jgi:hypothetical protein
MHADPDCSVLNPDGLKPDIVVYKKKSGRTRRTDFGLIEIHVEVKISKYDDPFDDDNEESFEHFSNASKDTKGQIMSYAVAQLGLQFRTHIFSVLIFDKSARLIRWDRSGAVVTCAFDFRDPHLIDFFRRYDRSTPAQRGVDMSVSTPTNLEAKEARERLNLDAKGRLLKFAVYSSEDDSVAYYIGNKPCFNGNASPTGRATRTFTVYDVQTKQCVFLKDTWRIDLPGLEKEGSIYECLHDAGVCNIAPFVRGEDIPHHHTRTHEFVSKSWARPIPSDLRPHQHYQLVLGVIGIDLKKFKSSWELVNAMSDALQGESVSEAG